MKLISGVGASDVSPNLVGGSWVMASDGATLAVLDPSDLRRVVGRVPAMTVSDVHAAFDAAAAGFAGWRQTVPLERAAVLLATAAALRARRDELAGLIVDEMGKTFAEASVEVVKSADFFEFYASLARLPQGELLADGRPNTVTSVRIEPVGVVLAIAPWNDPLLTPCRKLGPALAAGNSVVLKPSDQTPLIALRLAELLEESGLPAGVLGTVTGRSRDLADALIGHPRLAAVTFTGSTAVGREIERRLAGSGIRVQAELGGKNASVVLRDADLELSAATIASAAFAQAGQRCTATSRVVVEEPVAQDFLVALSERVERLVVGPGRDPLVTMGPVVSASHRESVLGYITGALAEGGRIVNGGGASDGGRLANGCFVDPTVVADVRPDMALWREEVFGPVLGVTTAPDFASAVELANDSAYGLSAAIFTRDLGKAETFISRIDTGQVSVNLPTAGWDVHHPFGGFGDSGSPFKEQGTSGLRFYTRIKTAAVRHSW